MNLTRSKLLIEYSAKKAFYGGKYGVHQRRDILNKPTNIPTSEGKKVIRVGRKGAARFIHVSRGRGELRTHGNRPRSIMKYGRKSPHRKKARRLASDKSFDRYKLTLLLAHHGKG